MEKGEKVGERRKNKISLLLNFFLIFQEKISQKEMFYSNGRKENGVGERRRGVGEGRRVPPVLPLIVVIIKV